MSVPAIATGALPADVRVQGTEAVKNYKTALGFEQMLVGQMVKSMVGSTGELAEGPYAETMQDTLSSSLVGGRGLGLAQQIYKEMQS
jgi:Rod binding domain-containing protein